MKKEFNPSTFDAMEAGELTAAKEIPFDEILRNIFFDAQNGNKHYIIPSNVYISERTKAVLMDKGFTLQSANDPFGVKVILVTWPIGYEVIDYEKVRLSNENERLKRELAALKPDTID